MRSVTTTIKHQTHQDDALEGDTKLLFVSFSQTIGSNTGQLCIGTPSGTFLGGSTFHHNLVTRDMLAEAITVLIAALQDWQ